MILFSFTEVVETVFFHAYISRWGKVTKVYFLWETKATREMAVPSDISERSKF